jgi:DNA-binding transcriptional LysR family regulator
VPERSIDLHLLRCFDALVAEESVTLAADRLRMSQPGMSNALARLREVFNDPILTRTTKGMSATERARQLAPSVRAAIDQLHGILEEPQVFRPETSDAVLHVAATDGTINCALEAVIGEIREEAPLMRIEVTPLLHGRLQEPLQSGAIDFALGVYLELPETLYHTRVIDDRLWCVVGRDSAHAQGEWTLERYRNAHHAVLTRGVAHRSSMETVVDKLLADRGIERQVRFAAPYAGTLLPMVARSDLVATVTGLSARMYAGWLPLKLLPLPFTAPPLAFSMVWHARTRNSPAAAWLRQKLRDGLIRHSLANQAEL